MALMLSALPIFRPKGKTITFPVRRVALKSKLKQGFIENQLKIVFSQSVNVCPFGFTDKPRFKPFYQPC